MSQIYKEPGLLSFAELTRTIRGFFNRIAFRSGVVERIISPFHAVGFHGDAYLVAMVKACLLEAEQFIETGANVGSTLYFVASSFPRMPLYSCEPHPESFLLARKRLDCFPHAEVLNQSSPDFLVQLVSRSKEICERDTVFCLDAHGYGYRWPLLDEISFITNRFSKAFIFIDDFKVPRHPAFRWDKPEDQECSFSFVRDFIARKKDLSLYYPDYTDQTSDHHPLTGWCLIEFGHGREFQLPENLRNKIEHISDPFKM